VSATTITDLDVVGGKYQVTATWLYNDPYELSGPPDLAHFIFEIEWSLSADMSSPTSAFLQGTYRQITLSAGQTLYVRVRALSISTTFVLTPGEWSDIVSATEISSGDDPWEENTWATFTPVAIFEVGTGSLTSFTSRYKRNGNIIFFAANVSLGLGSPSPSGTFRIGGIPAQMRSGGVFAGRAFYNPVAGGPIEAAAKIVDSGDGTAAVELVRYDGISVISPSRTFWVSGFFEADAA
jgi:hypothetical protein